MDYYVYIVRCSDNSLYTGITWNIYQRVYEHNNNKRGAKSLRGKLPVDLVYCEKAINKSIALKREKEIKSWRKEKKELLIKSACIEEQRSDALALKNEVLKRE